jgi:hypothetical protein
MSRTPPQGQDLFSGGRMRAVIKKKEKAAPTAVT